MSEQKAYSFHRIYRLKPQAPLVHFQGNQLFCTLRATEVKPRLDAFLRERAADRIDPSWKMRRADYRTSLRYQMHIRRGSATLYVDLGKNDKYPNYYGKAEGRCCLVGDVLVTIICTIPALRDLIDEYIGEFFLCHNFGTLQSKGFGSYVVEGREGTPDEVAAALKRKFGVEHCYMLEAEKPFCALHVLHSVMKPGLNKVALEGEGAYERSLLFTYLHERCGLGNEKAWIKREGLAGSQDTRPYPYDASHPPRFARALLGLTRSFRFRDGSLIRARSFDRAIQRHRSPLFFKVIGNRVYFLLSPIAPELYGAEFEFTSQSGRGTLRVPTKEELGEHFYEDFMNYCVDRLNGGTLDKFADTRGARIREVGI